MPPDHDHFTGSVNLDDAGSVMREIVLPIPAGLRRIPDRETGDQPCHPAEQARGAT